MIEFLKSCWYNEAIRFVILFILFLIACFFSVGIGVCLALHYLLGLSWLISSMSGILAMCIVIYIYLKI